jgi:hypothetical protein
MREKEREKAREGEREKTGFVRQSSEGEGLFIVILIIFYVKES